MNSVAKPLHFHPSVVADLQSAIEWYVRVSPKAAGDFKVAAKSGFSLISRSPKQHAIVVEDRDVRACHLKPFSYVIVYRELHDVVRVLGVRHTASDMVSWADRD